MPVTPHQTAETPIPTARPNRAPRREPSNGTGATARVAQPQVHNANRVVVGLPFSTVTVADGMSAAAVAELVARLSRLLAGSAPADAFDALATEAEALAARLRR